MGLDDGCFPVNLDGTKSSLLEVVSQLPYGFNDTKIVTH